MLARTLAAIGASALLLATPAAAQYETLSVNIRTGDLDLSTEAGQKQLDRRVFKAMGRICGELPRSLDQQEAHAKCRSEVITDASAKIAALKERSAESIQIARRTQ